MQHCCVQAFLSFWGGLSRVLAGGRFANTGARLHRVKIHLLLIQMTAFHSTLPVDPHTF